MATTKNTNYNKFLEQTKNKPQVQTAAKINPLTGRAPIQNNVVAKGDVSQADANAAGLLTRSQATQDLRTSAARSGVLPSQQQTQSERTQSSLVAPAAKTQELNQRARGLAGGSVNASTQAQAKFAKEQANLQAKQEAAFGQFKQSQPSLTNSQMSEYFRTGKGLSDDPEIAALQKKALSKGRGQGLDVAALQEIDDLYRSRFEQSDEYKAFSAEQDQFASNQSDYLAKETRNAAFGGQGTLQEIERDLGLVEGQKLIQNPATGRYEVQGERPDDVQIDPFLRAEERLEQQRQDGYSTINEQYDNTLSQLKGERDIYGRVSTQQKNRIARLIRQKKDATDKLEQSVGNAREDMIIQEQSRQRSIEDSLKGEDKSLSEQINDDLLDRYNDKIDKGLASDLVEARALVNKEIALMGDDPKARENISMWENMLQSGQVDTSNQVQTFQQAIDLTGDAEKAFNLLKATGNTNTANEFRSAWTEQKYGTQAMTRQQALDRQLEMYTGEETSPDSVMAFVKESEAQFPKSFIARQLENISNSDLANQNVRNTAQDFLNSEYDKFLDKPEEVDSVIKGSLKEGFSQLITNPDGTVELREVSKPRPDAETTSSKFSPEPPSAGFANKTEEYNASALADPEAAKKVDAIINSTTGTDLADLPNSEASGFLRSRVIDMLSLKQQELLGDGDLVGVLRASAGGKAVSDSTINKLSKARTTLSQLQGLGSALEKSSTKTIEDEDGNDLDLSPITGWLSEKNPWKTDAQVIKNILNSTVPNLARGVYGEVGVLTDKDIAIYSNTIPNLRQTDDVKKAVMAITLTTVRDSIKNTLEDNAAAGRNVSGYIQTYENINKQIKAIEDDLGITEQRETTFTEGDLGRLGLTVSQFEGITPERQKIFGRELNQDPDAVQQLLDIGYTPESMIKYFEEGKTSPAETGQTNNEFLKSQEGFREDAYLDSAGVPTIGYGFTKINGKPVEIGDTITQEDADSELPKQIASHSNFKNKVTVDLSPSQKEALASFEYNLGKNIWDQDAKTIIAAVNEKDFEKAGKLMLAYNKARDPETGELVEVKGLVNRRKREAELLKNMA